ncbi:NADH dehydrogenase subunit [Haloplanus aerogenes]|uniref:NADH dehydrogenase subunit n=1 Tax=Haloplanus aerogenes TaxID=660522 RepID=A0A3M0E6W8_9EURY|nr:NADH dehydrogenase subunit [Haloplanus aerogenes]AZH24552.1 NADH dehydrogenase subunit [Haloplanus aerogenes]RMB23793.1 RnfC-like protein [Haloplanus aerogenes]
MSLSQLGQMAVPTIATTIQNAGVSGVGGAGFPTHAKWRRLDDVDHLLVNHQESEPIYYMDRWLGRERAHAFAALFNALLDSGFETIVVTPKQKDRDWTRPLERVTDATVYLPADLPVDADDESGVVFAYTDDQYKFGMESVLLNVATGTVVGQDLPMDHGWIVQNTETLWNVYRALDRGAPTTRTYVHVAGNVPRHRFLDVPVGTRAADLLDAAGRPIGSLSDTEVLLHGGPGWSFRTDTTPEEFRVSKRTNAVLVMDREVVAANTYGEGRIDVLDARDWDDDHETEPTRLAPDAVGVPLVTNPAIDIVAPGEPLVSSGDRVEKREMIATPGDGISNAHHAPIDGIVTDVTDTRVDIRADVCPVD